MTKHEVQPFYKTLGKFTGQPHLSEQIARTEELRAQYERIAELKDVLTEARLQIEYLHEKFTPTGTSEAILARIYEVLGEEVR